MDEPAAPPMQNPPAIDLPPSIAASGDVLPAGRVGDRRRFRVRGLLGQPALAAWLEARLVDRACRASAATGLVRLRAGSEGDGIAAIARCVERFAAAPAAASPARQQRRSGGSAAGAASAAGVRWHHLPSATLRAATGTGLDGLASADAARRLKRDGPNRIADIGARSDWQLLAAQFASLPAALLAGSAVAALATRAVGDAAAIGAVLLANGGAGFATERRAERTVSALRRLAPAEARVLRDGVEQRIPADEVVVGDLLLLKPGDTVPADARVLDAHRLSVNEAALTGESLPVDKRPADDLPLAAPLGERPNMLHRGTVVSGGTGTALVIATGEHTVLGAMRALAEAAAPPRTRLQAELDGLGRRLALGAAALCAGVAAAGLLRGRGLVPVLRSAVALGIAAIPEGLPAVATNRLAHGVARLQRHRVYARRLDALENLGAVDIVAFDKTGTLTRNRMTVASVAFGRQIADAQKPWPADALLVAALCHELEPATGGWQGSGTELALLDCATRHGVDVHALQDTHPRLAAKQRSEQHAYMVTLHADARGALVAVKGRPQDVLARCSRWFDGRRAVPLQPAERRELLQLNDVLAGRGERVLALAIRRQRSARLGDTAGLTWLGLVGLADPLREGIAEAIARLRAAGIQPLMLTGDQLGTARAVARAAGLDGAQHILDAARLPADPAALAEAIAQAAGFARCTPQTKLAVIRALQQAGHVVAMIGDGLNDGPALKAADVGAAMGASGSEFAQAMSGLVLQQDHPDGLLDAIAEGRAAWGAMRRALRFLLATNFSELALGSASAFAGLPEPLDPRALLWINLVTDIAPALALGREPPGDDLMQRPPVARDARLLQAEDWRAVLGDAAAMGVAALAAFALALARHGASPRARTVAFLGLTGAQLLHALSARSERPLRETFDALHRANPWLLRGVLASVALQAATPFAPPLRRLLGTAPVDGLDALLVAAAALAPTWWRERRK